MNNEEMIVDKTVEKPFTLRTLYDKDLYPILDIIAKVFPEDLSYVFAQVATKEKSAEEVGIQVMTRLVLAVLRNIDLVREDLYALLSELSGVDVDELEHMPFGTTPQMVMAIAQDAKNASFFKEFSKLF